MEDYSKDQHRAAIFFLHKEGVSLSEAAERMGKVFGDSSPSRSTISCWMQRFSEGRKSIEDDPCSGRPTTVTTEDKVAAVQYLIQPNLRWPSFAPWDEFCSPTPLFSRPVTLWLSPVGTTEEAPPWTGIQGPKWNEGCSVKYDPRDI